MVLERNYISKKVLEMLEYEANNLLLENDDELHFDQPQKEVI
jgi:hypothetical protein